MFFAISAYIGKLSNIFFRFNAILLILLLPISVLAQANTHLYGISLDGKIVEFDKSNGATTVKLQLPSQYQPYEGLTLCNGEYYSSYEHSKLIKFIEDGKITVLVDTGFVQIKGLTCHENTVYVSYAPAVTNNNGLENNAGFVGKYDSLTNTVVPVWQNSNPVDFSIESIFSTSNGIYTSTHVGGYAAEPSCNGVGISNISLDIKLPNLFDTYTHTVTHKVFRYVRLILDGIAIGSNIDPLTGLSFTYGVRGKAAGVNSYAVATTTKLYRVFEGSGSSPCNFDGVQLIGQGSVDGVNDLAWGPGWGSILANKKTIWIPVKMLLSGGGL